MTVAGNGNEGYSGDGGPATQAELSGPIALALNKAGTLFILDRGNCVVRAVAPSGTIETVAGNGTCGYTGDGGLATDAEINPQVNDYPAGGGLAVDDAGDLYIGDSANNVIREVTPGGTITTFAGGADQVCASATNDIGDGCPAATASLFNPHGLAFSPTNDALYVADTNYNSVRRIDLNSTIVTTVSGPDCNFFCGDYSGDGGLASKALLNFPNDVAVDGQGNLYITDSLNCRIRKVAAATGIITTVAGNGDCGYSGDGGPATKAELNISTCLGCPVAGRVVVDQAGDLFIADTYNNRIREVSAATGRISTIAGTGNAGYSGDGGPADQAELNQPSGLALDGNGDLFISDGGNNVVREIKGLASTAASQEPDGVGVRNVVNLAGAGAATGNACGAGWSHCFSIQQNFWLGSEHGTTPSIWTQNVVEIGLNATGWRIVSCHDVFTALILLKYHFLLPTDGCLLSKRMVIDAKALSLPATIVLTTTLTHQKKTAPSLTQLTLAAKVNGLEIGRATVHVTVPGNATVWLDGSPPQGSGSSCNQELDGSSMFALPQLLIVGPAPGRTVAFETAMHGTEVATVQTTSGARRRWVNRLDQAVVTAVGCKPTLENGTNIAWTPTKSGNGVSFKGGVDSADQGVVFTLSP